MSKSIVVLYDERDAEIAESALTVLKGRGHAASIVSCDASADTLGKEPREAMAGAGVVVVVVREGGRGTRLLRAVEDEARAGTTVLSLMADASPGRAVSDRTQARIHALGDNLSAVIGGGARRAPRAWGRIAVVGALVFAVLAALAVFRFWPTAVSSAFGPKVELTGTLSSSGWIITFHLHEQASELEYKRPSDRDFVSTGRAGPGAGSGMGLPRANTYVVLSDIQGRVPFLVRYRTLEGAERGPYEAVFDTDAEAVSSTKRTLATVPAWIAFRDFSGRKLCYFTMLLSLKYALRSIRYGIDTEVPDQTVRFTPKSSPGIDTNDQLYIDLPDAASFVTVELVYLDGTASDRKRFDVR